MMKRMLIGIIVAIALLFAAVGYLVFTPTEKSAARQLVAFNEERSALTIIEELADKDSIRNMLSARIAFWLSGLYSIEPGGYYVSAEMSAYEIAKVFASQPSLVWVTIPEGLRKEEVAHRFSNILDWNEADIEKFYAAPMELDMLATEGVYYPDTYLVPKNESGADVARRMIRRFEEQYGSLSGKLLEENIKGDTALKIASLIQREAAGVDDMPLISGIIWNRLLAGMKLDIDATLQYIRGDTGSGYWAPIDRSLDRRIDSPYNTYVYSGLPPQPIANPGMDAILAVLNPADTPCFYYLHDASGEIHCAPTYAQHQQNIEQYLR